MKITACPLCGSKNVGMGGINDGVHPQEFLKQACKNCGWTGTPLEFVLLLSHSPIIGLRKSTRSNV
jgi:hypothetical protein